MLCYSVIDNISDYLKVEDNDRLKALCDCYSITYNAVDGIKINDYILKNRFSVYSLANHHSYIELYEEAQKHFLKFIRNKEFENIEKLYKQINNYMCNVHVFKTYKAVDSNYKKLMRRSLFYYN
jgi:hypothetical protein